MASGRSRPQNVPRQLDAIHGNGEVVNVHEVNGLVQHASAGKVAGRATRWLRSAGFAACRGGLRLLHVVLNDAEVNAVDRLRPLQAQFVARVAVRDGAHGTREWRGPRVAEGQAALRRFCERLVVACRVDDAVEDLGWRNGLFNE